MFFQTKRNKATGFNPVHNMVLETMSHLLIVKWEKWQNKGKFLHLDPSVAFEKMRNFYFKQESPPAWMQEAYRPWCSEYSFCCPILTDPNHSSPLPADWPDPPPPPHWLTHLTPPPAGWPPCQLTDLTPCQLTDLTPPPAGWPPPGGLTPPPLVDKLTKWNYYLPVVLRTRAVIIPKC